MSHDPEIGGQTPHGAEQNLRHKGVGQRIERLERKISRLEKRLADLDKTRAAKEKE